MTRARNINVARMASVSLIAAGMAAHLGTLAAAEPWRGQKGAKVIENRGQAMPKGAQRAVRGSRHDARTRAKGATAELVGASQGQIVLGHIHPRWLRAEVTELLDLGLYVDLAIMGSMRDEGPGGYTWRALAHPETL
jgi:hypothetical protein